RSMSVETRELLTISEVIAVDQDPKGVQGHRAWEEGPLEIWVKPLADGSQAIALFNRGESALEMRLDPKLIGAPPSSKLRDLLDHKDLGSIKYSFTLEVKMRGVALIS